MQAQDLCALLHMVDSMIRMPHANLANCLSKMHMYSTFMCKVSCELYCI